MTEQVFLYAALVFFLFFAVGSYLLLARWDRRARERFERDMRRIDEQMQRAFAEYERYAEVRGRRSAMPRTEPWWEVLGVSRDATKAEIEAAFRQKVRKAHPDVNGGEEGPFRRIQGAYETAKQSPTLH